MVAVGFMEILALVLLSGGLNSTDLVGLVEPAHYFKSRQIEPTLDRMIDIVIEDPKTPKAQDRQLFSLRYLADQADNFKKAGNYATNREAIEEIAQGKRANDPQGFAQEYAKRVLAKLDGVKPTVAKIRPMREDALNWFPADVRFATALDLRQAQDPGDDALKELLKLMPNNAKSQMYDQIEKLGNMRIERAAFGVVGAEKPGDQKLFVRITGKANPEWLAALLQASAFGNVQSKKSKAADGTPILTLTDNQGPIMMLIGDTDLLVVGFKQHNGRHEDVVAELLDVRAKKKPHAATGTLKGPLGKIPDKAVAFMVGDLPEDMKREFRGLIDPVPSKISAYVERSAKGLDVKLEATLANAEDAGAFLKKIGAARKEAVTALQQAMKEPIGPGMPPLPFQAIINLVESVQVQGQAERVQAQGFVPAALIRQIGQMSMRFRETQGFEVPPPPPPFPK